MILPTARVSLLLTASLCTASSLGQPLVANVQQGTNIALALSPDRETIVIDLLGQLWALPAAGGGATPLTPDDIVVRNPRFSPDGRHIVYQRAESDQWDVWLLDLGTRESRQLTGLPYDEREPDFTPDGRSVVFASDRAGRFDVWELGFDFGRLRQLSRTDGDASFPSVSELGAIAYTNDTRDGWSLEILEPDGTSRAVYRSANPLRAPSWRPGGGVLLFSEQLGASENGLRMVVLSPDPVLKTLTSGEDVFGFRPAWLSPAEYLYAADGQIWRRTIASIERTPVMFFAGVGVTRAIHPLRMSADAPAGTRPVRGIRAPSISRTGDARVFTSIGDLWLQIADGETTRLTDDAFLEIDPVLGPEGDMIVFASDRSGNMDLWRMSLAGGASDQLTREPGKAFRPAISPDGNRIAYLVSSGFDDREESELVIVELAGDGSARALTGGLLDVGTPAWSADGGFVELSASRRDGATVAAGLLRADAATGSVIWEPGATSEPAAAAAPEYPAPNIAWSPQPSTHDYALRVDRLFDGIGTTYRRNMDIHVRDGRIVDVAARGLMQLPDTVIDARSFTVMPGLIDMHAHQSGLMGERLGRVWLAYGVTTVREVDSDPDDALERREAWASGRRRGPRLLLTTTAPSTGSDASDIVELDSERLPDEPAMAAAAALGIPIFSNRLLPAVRLGINGLEHIGERPLRPFGLERSLLGRSYQDITAVLTTTMTAVAPTLTAFGGFGHLTATDPVWADELARTGLFQDAERDAWLDQRADSGQLASLQRTVADLVRAGSRITAGSDAPAAPYGLGLHAELALLAEAGLANDQVLRIATANAALALGLERELGTIEAGKRADFVILSGDPLSRIEDTLRVEATVLNGVWLTRDELRAGP